MTQANETIRILCFGDSNTWGYSPKDGSRYPSHVRWTGVLQSLLGSNFQIIEEGLNGRTTNLDYVDRIGRNGRIYLEPCLDSHAPLHYVILNLGANDTKTAFARSAEEICAATKSLIQIIQGKAKIILVAPTAIQEGVGIYKDQLNGATQKIATLATLHQALALQYGLTFVNLSHIEPSPLDGVHLSEEAHHQIAQILYKAIPH
ncbi:MAG: acylhydrolase [Deltaproteobacteria bacterium CG11_big_fil_rev_8_21_14_0_20_47_16]|nr:MAG: acylhydrolase [Deltaproteobacteria bacterium CG11_big_fil_rev_8_21_14_0_20_47_16]